MKSNKTKALAYMHSMPAAEFFLILKSVLTIFQSFFNMQSKRSCCNNLYNKYTLQYNCYGNS